MRTPKTINSIDFLVKSIRSKNQLRFNSEIKFLLLAVIMKVMRIYYIQMKVYYLKSIGIILRNNLNKLKSNENVMTR